MKRFKLFSLLTVLALLAALLCPALAETLAFSPLDAAGTIEYCFVEKEGVLILRGDGPMPAFDDAHMAPWDAYRTQIRRIILMHGITSVPSKAFRDLTALLSVSFPATLQTIATDAFEGCGKIALVAYDGDRAVLDAIVAANDVRELMSAPAFTDPSRAQTEADVEALLRPDVTAEPTQVPFEIPTAPPAYALPTDAPTATPTAEPAAQPVVLPTAEPTNDPTAAPTATPEPVFVYDEEGRLIYSSEFRADGKEYTYTAEYNGTFLYSEVNSVTEYSPQGQQAVRSSATDWYEPDGNAYRQQQDLVYRYDGEGRQTGYEGRETETDRKTGVLLTQRELWAEYAFDEHGVRTSGTEVNEVYTADGTLSERYRTDYTYDAQGNIATSRFDAFSYAYEDPDDPASGGYSQEITLQTYDEFGVVTSESTSTVYNKEGHLLFTDETVSETAYHPNGEVASYSEKSLSRYANGDMRFEGEHTEINDDKGRSLSSFTHTILYNETGSTAYTTEFEYDPDGNRFSSSDSQVEYDLAGSKIKEIRIERQTGKGGIITAQTRDTREYDSQGNPTLVEQFIQTCDENGVLTDSTNTRSLYAYDAQGRRVSSRTFALDTVGNARLEKETTYTYDEAAGMTHETTITYDADGSVKDTSSTEYPTVRLNMLRMAAPATADIVPEGSAAPAEPTPLPTLSLLPQPTPAPTAAPTPLPLGIPSAVPTPEPDVSTPLPIFAETPLPALSPLQPGIPVAGEIPTDQGDLPGNGATRLPILFNP